MKSLLVLGYFGYNTNQLDGQTVKTRDVYRLATEQFDGRVEHYDTEDFRFNKFSILQMFGKLLCCNTLFYLPAHNNLKYIFPIVFLLSLVFRFKIHYFVVGGWLREYISDMPMHRYMLKHISGIHVETKRLKRELEEYYRFGNVDMFPNFRFFDFEPERFPSDKLRLVFMARINKMKGLDWIFAMASYIEKYKLQHLFSLTFYGPIHDEDQEYFSHEISKYSFAEYRGVLQPDEIYAAMNDYDVLLLPTHYYTEGLPGSIVDAYISGLPVIVTEWKHSREFVEDGKSGYIVPFIDGELDFIDRVLYLEKNRDILASQQDYALHKRMEFAPPSIIRYI